jgi:hypothetical protein
MEPQDTVSGRCTRHSKGRVVDPMEKWMQLTDDFFGMVLTYLVWIWTVALAHQGDVISFLGFVLLIARLVHDVPKAYKAIRGWFSPKE